MSAAALMVIGKVLKEKTLTNDSRPPFLSMAAKVLPYRLFISMDVTRLAILLSNMTLSGMMT